MLQDIRRDCLEYRSFGGWWRNLGFWVTATYRLGAWARELPLPWSAALGLLHWLLRQPWRLFLHVELPPTARIGGGLLLVHPYNVLIGADVQLGEGCMVFHEVTVGMGPTPGMPRIGRDVVLFVGARVLGGIELGDAAEIGANCVVTRSVPAASVVAPTPGQVIPKALLRRGPADTPVPTAPVEPRRTAP